MKKVYKTKGYRPSKRGLTLVGKNGRITPNSKKNVEKFKQMINERKDLSEKDKIDLLADVDAYVFDAHRNGRKLTTNGFLGKKYAKDSITRMLTNAGYSVDEFAKEAGVSEEEVMNEDNWKDSMFMGMFEINFQYTGSIIRYVDEEN